MSHYPQCQWNGAKQGCKLMPANCQKTATLVPEAASCDSQTPPTSPKLGVFYLLWIFSFTKSPCSLKYLSLNLWMWLNSLMFTMPTDVWRLQTFGFQKFRGLLSTEVLTQVLTTRDWFTLNNVVVSDPNQFHRVKFTDFEVKVSSSMKLILF